MLRSPPRSRRTRPHGIGSPAIVHRGEAIAWGGLPGRALGSALLAALALSTMLLQVANAKPSEQAELQAAFVSRIARFVNWPEGSFATPADPIRVGLLGEDAALLELASALEQVKSGSRGFAVQKLGDTAEAESVHVVIVGAAGKLALRKVARQLKGKPVLSIAPSLEFAEDGGILGMEVYRGKVAFEVNNRSARAADLKISSRVLRLASNVY